MRKLAIVTLAAAVLGSLSFATFAQGPGQCGKGKKWDAKEGKCVSSKPAPKGKGSGAGSGSGSG